MCRGISHNRAVPRPFPELLHPIIQAPLSGGPSTPELAAAVSETGGLGFLALGYLSLDQARGQIEQMRSLTTAPFGVNVFCLSELPVDQERLAAFARRLASIAAAHDVELGAARFEDDAFDSKVRVVAEERVAIASFTFGCPSPQTVDKLHDRDVSVWVTVTEVEEAVAAAAVGADALVVQGAEAGGHRATFSDADGRGEIGLLALLRLIARRTELPLVAAGGIADGAGVAAVLAAGARAAQIGTAFMRSPEAATSTPHREALARSGATRLTRAFSGRRARGIVNRFMLEHEPHAPAAYPHVHHLTAPLRKAARAAGEAELINLWAGQAYELAEERPARELVEKWAAEARAALEEARSRLG
jgi:nitronate monooxygenase